MLLTTWPLYDILAREGTSTAANNQITAAERQFNWVKEKRLGRLLWKYLHTGQWKGLDPVFILGQEYACVFLENVEWLIWVPEHAVQLYHEPRLREGVSSIFKEADAQSCGSDA